MKKHLFKNLILIITTLLLAGSISLFFTGCKAEKYKVDYCGQKFCYSNAKDSYKAGSKVTLYYEFIATDTDYSFTLDGRPIDWSYDDEKGFIVEFTMPEHNVTLECHTNESMVAIESE